MPVDGPYHGQKGDAWDNEHKTAADFLRWKGERYAAWRRILAPNGTIYDFASPAMGARTEVAMREHFEVLCNIRWAKPSGRGDACSKESLRAPFPQSETIIMAEQRGSDSIALGESQYGAKCDELRGFVFEPIRAYLDGERERSGFSRADVDRMLGNQMSGHYFSRVQWALPTLTNYEKLQAALNSGGGGSSFGASTTTFGASTTTFGASTTTFGAPITSPPTFHTPTCGRTTRCKPTMASTSARNHGRWRRT
jgi:site-specific DNA-methyltransferase (adenine-specific)